MIIITKSENRNFMKSVLIVLIFFGLFFSFSLGDLYGEEKNIPSFKWQVGEELIYQVKWMSLPVATLKFHILKKDTLRNRSVYHSRLYLDTNPKLPFVDIHEVYDSFIDEQMYSHRLEILIKKSEFDYVEIHDIDYKSNQAKITVHKYTPKDTTLIMDSTLPVSGKMQDGVSIFYYSRAFAGSQGESEISVVSLKEIKPAQIRNTGKIQKIRVKDQNVSGYLLNGQLRFESIGGVKDEFKGWFSLDSQRVPLKAYLKAVLGYVTIELKDWKNWKQNVKNPETGK